MLTSHFFFVKFTHQKSNMLVGKSRWQKGGLQGVFQCNLLIGNAIPSWGAYLVLQCQLLSMSERGGRGLQVCDNLCVRCVVYSCCFVDLFLLDRLHIRPKGMGLPL